MKDYHVDYYSNKAAALIQRIIKSEDLAVVLKFEEDALGNLAIIVSCDEEDYKLLSEVYRSVK